MKKFKDLVSNLNLNESEYSEGGALGGSPSAPGGENSIHSDVGVHRVELDSQRKRINAFLNAFARKEYLDPKAALGILRSKLNIIGLDFDFNPKKSDCEIAMETGEPIVYKLTRFGGVFGTAPDHDLLKNGFINSDGISDARNGVGLNLIVNLEQTPNGLFRVNVELADATSEVEDNDDEAVEVAPEEQE
tara:strand:- start:2284 stop:2853 length:570 start_codon:yes stop_codon:yes gene_type:complete